MDMNETKGLDSRAGDVTQSPEQKAFQEVADLPDEIGELQDFDDWLDEALDLPEKGTPRCLEKTEQTWREEPDGSRVFDSPEKTSNTLDFEQGKNPEFQGTCGLVSCENVLRLAGMNVTEQDIVNFAAKHQPDPLCYVDRKPNANGATSDFDRKKIFEAFGVPSYLEIQTVDAIAEAVESGRGVIVSVDAGKFYENAAYNGAGHAVTVVSTRRDPDGELQGFYICDSNSVYLGTPRPIYMDAAPFQDSLRQNRRCNITTNPIR